MHHDLAAPIQVELTEYRAHPGEEVYVTGTFDDWSKSIKLEKEGSVFEKTVDLPNATTKWLYKVRFIPSGEFERWSPARRSLNLGATSFTCIKHSEAPVRSRFLFMYPLC